MSESGEGGRGKGGEKFAWCKISELRGRVKEGRVRCKREGENEEEEEVDGRDGEYNARWNVKQKDFDE